MKWEQSNKECNSGKMGEDWKYNTVAGESDLDCRLFNTR